MIILITSAKYSSSDFSLEFGPIPPAFLPLGNKRLYEYQADLFKNITNKNIFLSLPKGYELSKFDEKKLKKLDIKTLFAPESLKLGASIVYCLNLLSITNEELFVFHGDTLFKKLEIEQNSLQITKIQSSYNWAFLDSDFTLTNKGLKRDNLILSGAYHITKPHILIKTITECEYNFVAGLKAYSKYHAFKALRNDTWLDFGLITSYFHSKKVVSTSRVFNKLNVKDGYIEKSSSWAEKIKAEKEWFNALPTKLLIHTPRFVKKHNKYSVEYLYNNTLAELFVFGKLPNFVWKNIFISIKDFLNKLHSFKSVEQNLNFNYKEKTLQRLKEFSKENNINLDQPIKLEFNGKLSKLPSLLKIVQKLDKFISQGTDFRLIHGDFCFSNIMYDFRANTIKTFDPRGLDFSSKITPFGDANYDFAKLMHSVFGLYDFIICGFYECQVQEQSIRLELELSKDLQSIQNEFLSVFDFKNLNEIKAINIHLFLSMLPLHNDDKNRQNALLANALRLFIDLKDIK